MFLFASALLIYMYYFIFLFLFLFFLSQGDALAYGLSLVCGCYVAPHRWLFALALTAVAYGVTGWGLRRTEGKVHPAAVWTMTTFLAVTVVNLPFVGALHHAVFFAVGAAGAAALAYGAKRFPTTFSIGKEQPLGVRAIRMALAMIALALYAELGCGVTDIQHYELRTAQALRSSHPERAYRVGDQAYATSPRLFAMRCYLLATSGKHHMGSRLFEQTIPPQGGAANLLLPTDERQRLLFPADSLYALLGAKPNSGEQPADYFSRCAELAYSKNKQGRKLPHDERRRQRAAYNYCLAARLLERDLPGFAQAALRYFPGEVRQGRLPRYYSQAFVLYKRSTASPLAPYRDNNTEANFQDYSDMGDTIPNLRTRANLLRRSYGETYWWWYSYGKQS